MAWMKIHGLRSRVQGFGYSGFRVLVFELRRLVFGAWGREVHYNLLSVALNLACMATPAALNLTLNGHKP